MTVEPRRPVSGKDVVVALGLGVAVAGLAGIAAGAAFGTGVVAAALQQSRRRALDSITRDAEGRLDKYAAVLAAVKKGGVAPTLRPELWPLLLGVYAAESIEDERLGQLAGLRKLYTKLVLCCQELDKQLAAGAAASTQQQQQQQEGAAPDGREEELPGNVAAFEEAHRIIVMDVVRTDFSRHEAAVGAASDDSSSGGGSPDKGKAASGGDLGTAHGNPTVTLLPLSVIDGLPELVLVDLPRPSTADSAEGGDGSSGSGGAEGEAEGLLGGADEDDTEAHPPLPTPGQPGMHGNTPLWCSRLAADTLAGAAHVPPRAKRQMLRLVNVLSAYAVHDPEIGYCQGMSDLAAVFISMFDDDALAFACFERLMRQARRNFLLDETGIKQQLHQVASILELTDLELFQRLSALGAAECMFAFRMVVVMLRRELSAEHACTLWEMQWAHEAAEALQQQQQQQQQQQGFGGGSTASRPGSASGLARSGGSSGSLRAAGSSGSLAAAVEQQPLRPGSSAQLRTSPSAGSLGSAGGGGGGGSGSEDAAADGNFQHWFIAAVVRAHRRTVLHECADADDVLRLFNGVKIDFWSVLSSAERSWRRFHLGRAVIQRL